MSEALSVHVGEIEDKEVESDAKPELKVVDEAYLKRMETVKELVQLYMEDSEGMLDHEREDFINLLKHQAAEDKNEVIKQAAIMYLKEIGEEL